MISCVLTQNTSSGSQSFRNHEHALSVCVCVCVCVYVCVCDCINNYRGVAECNGFNNHKPRTNDRRQLKAGRKEMLKGNMTASK